MKLKLPSINIKLPSFMGRLKGKIGSKRGGLTVLSFDGHGTGLVHFTASGEVNVCEHVATQDMSDVKKAVSAAGISNTPALFVLNPSDYHLNLVKKPNVPDEELSSALLWETAELTGLDLQTGLNDFMLLPNDAYRSRECMVYSCTVSKQRVDVLSRWCEEVGLHLEGITVPEAAASLPVSSKAGDAAIGVLSIGGAKSSINMLANKHLYMTRQMDYSGETDFSRVQQAILEIQRTFDYFRSQVGGPMTDTLYLPPEAGGSEFAGLLHEMLQVNVEYYPIRELVSLKVDIEDGVLGQCFTALMAGHVQLKKIAPEVKQAIHISVGKIVEDKKKQKKTTTGSMSLTKAASITGGLGVGTLALSAGLTWYAGELNKEHNILQTKKASVIEQVAVEQERLASMKPTAELVAKKDSLNNELESLRLLTQLIDQIQDKQTIPLSSYLRSFSKATLIDTWVTHFVVDIENKIFGMTGYANTPPAVTKLLESVAKAEAYKGIEFDKLDVKSEEHPSEFTAAGELNIYE